MYIDSAITFFSVNFGEQGKFCTHHSKYPFFAIIFNQTLKKQVKSNKTT